ncbi:MAG TPA: flippase [Bryobacteraceae bacterium]|nr:flippase [Bryobacteraceae bacterium]
MRRKLHRAYRSVLFRNAAALYGVQACRKLIPLVSIPYLARVLGPEGWGTVAFVQALGEFIVMVVEFGFNLSATREIAQKRDSRAACGEVVAGTLGAQAGLSLFAVLGAMAAATQIPLLRDHPKLFMAGLFYGVIQGIAPLWFFQGLERMMLAGGLEISSKIAALGALLLFVRGPGDEWLVLALQGVAPAVSTVAGLWLAFRLVRLRLPSLALVKRSLALGWPMFLIRSSASLYGVANVFVLGLFAPAAIVGYYASAEKIVKAVCGLLLPIRESLYPRLSQLAIQSPEENKRLTRIGAFLMGGGGLFLGIVTFAAAPWISHVLLGAGFDQVIPVLRILALLPVIISLTDSVGMQYLLPRGRESIVNRVVLGGGFVSLALAFVLAPRYQHIGMASAVVIAEAFVCGVLAYVVFRMTSRDGEAAVAERPGEPGEEEFVGALSGGDD